MGTEAKGDTEVNDREPTKLPNLQALLARFCEQDVLTFSDCLQIVKAAEQDMEQLRQEKEAMKEAAVSFLRPILEEVNREDSYE